MFSHFSSPLWRVDCASKPNSQDAVLTRSLYYIGIMFFSCLLTQMNLTGPSTIERVEAKNCWGTEETWVIRVEKCHFGSCCRLYWSVRGLIKSDSCTIDNAPPAHPQAEQPSTHSASSPMQRDAFTEPGQLCHATATCLRYVTVIPPGLARLNPHTSKYSRKEDSKNSQKSAINF